MAFAGSNPVSGTNFKTNRMKKIIFSIVIVSLLFGCKKSEIEIETEKLELEKAIYELREAKLEYVKTLIYIKKEELYPNAEILIDSLIKEEKKILNNDSK